MMTTREDELKKIPLMNVDKSDWPDGLRTIAMDETDAFSVDKYHRLYWNGKLLEIKRPLMLTKTQAFFGVGAAVAAVLMAIFDFIRLLNGQ